MQQATTVSANLNYASGKPTGNLYLKPDCSRRPRLNPSISYSTTNVASRNFFHWDVAERGPKSELSSNWARQTAARLRGGAHPFLPHSRSPHPAVPLHLRPHRLTPLVFYVHFNFLLPLWSELRKELLHQGRHKHFNTEVTLLHSFYSIPDFVDLCINLLLFCLFVFGQYKIIRVLNMRRHRAAAESLQ